MTGIVFSVQTDATRLQRAVDGLLGYPRDGVDVGGGRHVSPTFRTERHNTVLPHPTLPSWAVIVDGAVESVDGLSRTIDGTLTSVDTALAVTLDATWTPTVTL